MESSGVNRRLPFLIEAKSSINRFARCRTNQASPSPYSLKSVRSDNGSELLTGALQEQMKTSGIRLANIEPGKPWQNGSNERFNGTFRKECLNAEIFASLTEARVIIEKWRRRYNERRPHSSQNYITPEMAYFGVREKRKA